MIDRHHILFNRQEWTIREESAMLRNSPELIPRLDREVHSELHRIAPAVPLLGYHATARVYALYEPEYDTMRSLDNLMAAIEEAGNHRKAHRVERGLAELALEALEIQRAILRGNIIERDSTTRRNS